MNTLHEQARVLTEMLADLIVTRIPYVPRWKIIEAINPSVVSLKGRKPQNLYPGEIYIGRPMYMGGWKLPGSKWANPYRIGRDGSREEVIEKYRAYVISTLKEDLHELRGKKLACWCKSGKPFGKPFGKEQCHGDVLIQLQYSETQYSERIPEKE